MGSSEGKILKEIGSDGSLTRSINELSDAVRSTKRVDGEGSILKLLGKQKLDFLDKKIESKPVKSD